MNVWKVMWCNQYAETSITIDIHTLKYNYTGFSKHTHTYTYIYIYIYNYLLSEVKVTYSQVWWPILGIRALHLPIQEHTHIAVNTHTHCEHTPGAVGSHLCCGTQGAVGGSVPCSRAPRRGFEGGESAVHSLPPPTIRLGVRLSTIRPRLPQIIYICIYIHIYTHIYTLFKYTFIAIISHSIFKLMYKQHKDHIFFIFV